MISKLFKRFSGSHYRKFIKEVQPIVDNIIRIEETYQKLTDDELKNKTNEFKDRIKKGESLDDILPEAFATVKNTARRLMGKEIVVSEHPLVWDMIHYDVQLIGGIVLHRNKIAEMATGEGKTLVATLPLYLNALTGRNCQLVTVNDYLSRRDSEWMGYIYKFLGLTVGCIQNWMGPAEKKEMYKCDITYGTASEYGFDYLRDNGMATRGEDQVQRDHYFIIIDEVDSILIDEARTPLIISGPAQATRELPFNKLKAPIERLVKQQLNLGNRQISDAKNILESESDEDVDVNSAYEKILQVKLGSPKNKQYLRLMENGAIRKTFEKYELDMHSDFNRHQFYALKEELYYVIDEKQHTADLSEKGRRFLKPDDDDAFVLPDLPTIFVDVDKDETLEQKEKDVAKAAAQERFELVSEDIHGISQLLRAYSLYERDVEYVVKDGKVMIVDENTGRVMPGRRWSDGLHQAVEAKENVAIEKESKTFATITIQNYFRLYDKIAGMTGTAETEANEFNDIYKLTVMVIPTNRECMRVDKNDVIYKTRREKYNSVIKEIQVAHEKGQPVLVGTSSVESSEVVHRMLQRVKIPNSVLNAKFHEQEAEIIANAGQRGSVTIATNMAGRGTDIKLGEGVAELGGLYVIGTERHTSRRIDRQLRGRCARQGDPGSTKFHLSLEDDLMRLYGQAGMAGAILEKTFVEGEPMEHKMLNTAIERAQKTVEQQHYSIRKRLLQYDDVLNKQREIIYSIRNEAINTEKPKELIFELINEELESRLINSGVGDPKAEDFDTYENFISWVNSHFPISLKKEEIENLNNADIQKSIIEKVSKAYETKESVEDPDALVSLERYVLINSIDHDWQDHLTEIDELRQSVGLRGYGQKDPLNEFKSEAFVYFEQMMNSIRSEVCTGLFRSATNMKAFENMLSLLSRKSRASGPSLEQATQLSSSPVGGSKEKRTSTGKSADDITLPKVSTALKRDTPKVGRNSPCPCGSGKKYKKCCYPKFE